LRVVIVRNDRLEHRYYHFGEIPNRIDLKKGLGEPAKPKTGS
jgi:hypothetical protein